MKVHLCVVGRLRAGPEKTLIDDYLTRFQRSGRVLGLGPVNLVEVEDKKNLGMKAEADLLRRAIPTGSSLCVLDERGKQLASPDFAANIARFRDDGAQNLTFVIGGADGLDPSLHAEANLSLSFGKMVWPHMIARLMLSEQLYRAATILSGTPYHRC